MDLVLLVAAVCTAPTANINMLKRGSAFIADHHPTVVDVSIHRTVNTCMGMGITAFIVDHRRMVVDVYIVQIEGICINENPFKITTEFICGGLWQIEEPPFTRYFGFRDAHFWAVWV